MTNYIVGLPDAVSSLVPLTIQELNAHQIFFDTEYGRFRKSDFVHKVQNVCSDHLDMIRDALLGLECLDPLTMGKRTRSNFHLTCLASLAL